MGLRPTRASENLRRRPRAGGGPRKVDSRLRGNDLHELTLRRVRQPTDDEEYRVALKTLGAGFLAPLGMTEST
jgi:hypothetical protein